MKQARPTRRGLLVLPTTVATDSVEDVVSAYQKSLGKGAGKIIDFLDAVSSSYGVQAQFAHLEDGINGTHVSGTSTDFIGA